MAADDYVAEVQSCPESAHTLLWQWQTEVRVKDTKEPPSVFSGDIIVLMVNKRRQRGNKSKTRLCICGAI